MSGGENGVQGWEYSELESQGDGGSHGPEVWSGSLGKGGTPTRENMSGAPLSLLPFAPLPSIFLSHPCPVLIFDWTHPSPESPSIH